MADNDGDSDEARVLRPLQAAACTYRIAFGPRAGQKVLTVQGAIFVGTLVIALLPALSTALPGWVLGR